MKQIYVHGLGQTSDSWEKTITQFADDENCVCPDLAEMVRGNEVTYENLYTAFSAACNSYDGSLNLCGLSLGGVLALNYAIDYPQKVNALVLIAVQYKMPKCLLQLQNAIFRFMPKSMFTQTGFQKRDFLQLCQTMMCLDFSKSLEQISCPTLIICGEKDSANKNACLELAALLKDAKIQIIDGARHEINVEAPEQLASILCLFYENTVLPI